MKYPSGALDQRVADFLARDLLPIADKMTDPLRDLLARPGAQVNRIPVVEPETEQSNGAILGCFQPTPSTASGSLQVLCEDRHIHTRCFVAPKHDEH